MFTAEKVRKIPTPESSFMDDKSEELSQIKVSIKDVLEQVNKMNSNKSPRSNGFHPNVLRNLNIKLLSY